MVCVCGETRIGVEIEQRVGTPSHSEYGVVIRETTVNPKINKYAHKCVRECESTRGFTRSSEQLPELVMVESQG